LKSDKDRDSLEDVKPGEALSVADFVNAGNRPILVPARRKLRKGGMRSILNAIVIGVCLILVGPLILLANIGTRIFNSEEFFVFGSQCVSLIPSKLGTKCRTAYYWGTLEEYHLDTFVLFGTLLPHSKTRIGHHCKIGEYAIVGYSHLGANVGVCSKVSIIAGRYQHNFTDTTKGVFDTEPVFECITIGDDVFLGEASIIMANVGEKSIIGAGGVVVKDIPPYSIAVGNPARVIKTRQPDGDWTAVARNDG
jgi:acetyltransferase-like isoleucine patch superfamily enzyme